MIRTFAVTGVTGTVGRAVLDRLSEGVEPTGLRLKEGYTVWGLASGESRIKELEMIYRDPASGTPSSALRLYAADLLDEVILDRCVGVSEAVIHTAAKKHVDYVQRAPGAAFRTNVYGTLLVAEACRRHNKPLVFTSTDKAVAPVGFYGWTKKVAEEIVLGLDQRAPKGRPAGVVVRSGNVLGSSGSVFSIWRGEAQRGFISKFNDGHRRYFVDREELAELLLAAPDADCRGSVVVPAKQHLWSMDLLADALANHLGIETRMVSRAALKDGAPEKRQECLYTEAEARAGRVLLWDRDAGLRQAPPVPPVAEAAPTREEIDRLWTLADEEARRSVSLVET